MQKMRTYSVINLGCKVNRAESDSVELDLANAGMVSSKRDCDIVVVNTCTVTAVAEKKTRKTVRQALAANPKAKVIVTGCAAAQNRSVYEDMSERVEVVQKWDLQDYLDDFKRGNIDCLAGNEGEASSESKLCDSVDDIYLASSHELSDDDDCGYCRANVKVQDGCINECTYCIIHKLRGPEVSIDPEKVLERTRQLADSGIAEVILSGINLGRYDHEGQGLADLCNYLLEGEDRCRFRLSSIEPNNITDEIIECVANADGRICRHFHLPLQSGCDRTLKAMGRKYSASEYKDVIVAIRNAIPSASISTDVIVGFPGETEEDFEETVRFCKEIGFSKMHVFPYSLREGTPAYSMDGQIEHSVKNARAKALRDIAAQLREQDLAKRYGTHEMAVVEDESWCMTESYHRVPAPKGSIPGTFVEVLL